MAHIYELSAKELEQIIAFVRDGAACPPASITDKLFNLCQAFGKKTAESLAQKQGRIRYLENRLERYASKEQAALERGEFEETGLDSLEVAKALLYQLQQVRTYRLTKNKLIYILYLMYASWLASQKQRLFDEHPQATSWGPQLWRVYNHFTKATLVTVKVPYEDWQNITQKSPAIAAFIKNSANKYYDRSETSLRDDLLKSKPYRLCVADKNGGKWNKELSDYEIYEWKKELKKPTA